MEYYYIGHIDIPSVLTKMETELSNSLREYEYSVIAESELDTVVSRLLGKQQEILSENSRLKKVDVRWSKLKYVSSNVGASIYIGRNIIMLVGINKFIGVFHEPDNAEGISAEELKHQMYGAKVMREQFFEKASNWLLKNVSVNMDLPDTNCYLKSGWYWDFKDAMDKELL